MKRALPHGLTLLFALITTVMAVAQNPTGSKPKQFAQFPQLINCSQTELARVFTSARGQQITLNFSDNFIFKGQVTSIVEKYSNLHSAVITSPDYDNTIFSVSKITNKDNTVTYVGRIVNKKYFDGYELKPGSSGNYELQKIETDRAIQDCSQH